MTNQTRIEIAAGGGHFLCHFYMQAFPTLALVLPHALGISSAAALELNFYMALLFGLGALPAGLIGDRWSSRGMLLISFFGMAGCCALCALCQSAASLRWALAGVGLFASMYHPVGMGLISKVCPDRGRALGRNGVSGSLGIGAAPLVTGELLRHSSISTTFLLLAAPSLLFGLFVLLAPLDETPIKRKLTHAERKGDLTGFIMMLVWTTILGIAYRATTQVLPTHFVDRIGENHATQLAGLVLLVAMVGQLLGGRAADTYDLRKAYLCFHLVSIPLVLAIGHTAGIPLVAAATMYYMLSLGMQPIENSIVARITPDRLRATGYGIKFLCCFGVGALGVELSARMAARHSVAALYELVAAMIVGMLTIFGLFWWRTRKQSFTH